MILAPFIYDNTRLLLLSKTDKFPNGLANSSGQLGKHVMAHIMAESVRRVRRPLRQHLHGAERAETQPRRFQRRQFRSQRPGLHSRRANFSRSRRSRGRPDRHGHEHGPAARHAEVGRGVSRFPREIFRALRAPSSRRPKISPTPTRPSTSIPTCAISGACPRRASPTTGGGPNERARVEFLHAEDGRDRPRHGRDASVARSPRARALPARTTKAARAWATIRKLRW